LDHTKLLGPQWRVEREKTPAQSPKNRKGGRPKGKRGGGSYERCQDREKKQKTTEGKERR